jgi:hypothetical protein
MPKTNALTTAQKATLKEVLVEWMENEHEVLYDAFNYEMSRKEVIARSTRMINIALILEQAVGMPKKQAREFLFSNEEIKDITGELP